ncbi:MAG: hypothetical protein NTY53_21550 [Kiritimatiellaeota bacterium]|nr:hypothetical protein [Kiritimatiellota bacterium]
MTWLLRKVYRLMLEVPINMAYAQAHGDELYDGVGGNAAVLGIGWVEPLVVASLVLLAILVCRKFKRSH